MVRDANSAHNIVAAFFGARAADKLAQALFPVHAL
jgi:hypothetical protein